MASYTSTSGPGFIGLREMLRGVVQKDVFRASKKAGGWLVLVLDDAASRVLTPILGMYDLMEEGVTLVESLEKRRQPFPDMDVIYVAAACSKSIRAIVEDWQGTGPDGAPYGDAHAFFLSGLSDDQVADLGAVPELARRLKSLCELNLDFLAVESQAFSLGVPDAFSKPSGLGSGLTESERDAARKFATVVATLGESAPIFRYRSDRGRAFADEARTIASKMTKDLRTGKKKKKERAPATVLILDRADDPLSPLLHEYTYQALVQDMLDVDGECRDKVLTKTQTKGGESKEEVTLLNEKDALWVEFRHVHVATVVDELRKRIKDFLTHNAGAAKLAKGAGNELSLGDMAAALKKMPEFQAATAALNKHMGIASECLNKFQGFKILETSQLEQTLITGIDDDGEKIAKPQHLLDDVCDLISSILAAMSTASTSLQDKQREHLLRLVACYFVARGGRLAEKERNQILEAVAPTPTGQAALLALSRLVAAQDGGQIPALTDAARLAPIITSIVGKKATRGPAKKKASSFSVFKNTLKAAARSALSDTYDDVQDDTGVASSRYTPPIKAILEAAAYDRLPPEMYPPLPGSDMSRVAVTNDAPATTKVTAQSVRNRNNRFSSSPAPQGGAAASSSSGPRSFLGSRLIVLYLGGVTYSELRCAYEVSDTANKEILIGGTTLLTPHSYITKLAGN